MPKLTPEQINKLTKIAKVLDNGDEALLEQIFEIEDKVSELENQIPALRQAVDGERGERGEKGEKGDSIKGDKGADGKDGKDGVDGKDGKDGTNGKDGRDGLDGKDGKDGIDGKDGEMGVIDEATIGYIEDEIKRVEEESKKRDLKEPNIGMVIRSIKAGTGITLSGNDPSYVTISSEGGGSSAWGDITGTLSAQADLQSALDGKADDIHSHAISDVTGLQTSLDGKQDVLTGLNASVVELNYTDGVTAPIQTQLDSKLDDTQFSGLSKIAVGTIAPETPATGDLWVDTN